jgi:hypothetical protein
VTARPRKPAAAPRPVPTVPPAQLFPQAARADAWALETSRSHWQYGVWDKLAAIDIATLEDHPDRAKLALLSAAGHLQAGAQESARRAVRQALDWGADRSLTARVLAASLHNTLGRVAVLLGDDGGAAGHFRQSVAIVEPGADVTLLAGTRQVRETARLGLVEQAAQAMQGGLDAVAGDPVDAAGRLAALKGEMEMLQGELRRALQRDPAVRGALPVPAASVVVPAAPPAPEPDASTRANPRFDARAFAVYGAGRAAGMSDFLYLDVKSLPRSGLHYMQQRLQGILQKSFSFCEWYTEPGCCRRMPCAVTGFITASGSGEDRHLLRMVKSHDFDLTDPVYPLGGALRRIVLIRDPLFILSSWWVLEQLNWNQDLLKEHGMDVRKIRYQHEAPVLAAAFDILAAHASLPPVERTAAWLADRKTYILGFVGKWARGAEKGLQTVVAYRSTNSAIAGIVSALGAALPIQAQDRLAAFMATSEAGFVPRRDPFDAPIPTLTQYLNDNAGLFRTTAAEILREDQSGLLQSCADNG